MLFTFPSRYWFTIGRQGVFSLTGWSPRIPPEFHVLRGTRDAAELEMVFAYGAITLYDGPSQVLQLTINQYPYGSPTTPQTASYLRFRLFPFRSPLLRKSSFLSLPPGTEMFQFPGFASCSYVFTTGYCLRSGFPHSDIFGSGSFRDSPKLIAA